MLGKDIVNLVVVKMDEYTPYGPSENTPLLAGGDHMEEIKPVYSYIRQSLAEAANEMLLIAPIYRLVYKTAEVVGTPDEDDRHVGTISLPEDFLRLHTLRMEGWTVPIHEAAKEGDPVYRLQFTRWTRGTKQKPVATITGRGLNSTKNEETTNVINQELHYYSCDAKESHEVKTFKYIPCFNENTEYEASIAELIALQCARKVFQIYGNTEQVGIMTSEINSVIENLRQ